MKCASIVLASTRKVDVNVSAVLIRYGPFITHNRTELIRIELRSHRVENT